MAQQRTPGKAWTASEDEKLIEAVQKHGDDTESWKAISEAVPGRTNKACRKRWKHSLHPSIKKTPWELDEDDLLLRLYTQHPGRWALIATHIPGRTDDACAKRYREALDPSLKKDDWTKEEDERLLDGYHRHGAAWGKVGEELGRSSLGCRNRWRLLERRKAAEHRTTKGSSSGRSKRKTKGTASEDMDTTDDADWSEDLSEARSNRERTSSFTSYTTGDDNESLRSTTPPFQWDPSSNDFIQHPLGLPGQSSSFVIDPSIINMALGKCLCGCASGTKRCNCSSTTPSLNLAPDPDLFAALDWHQLFPYLQAELPTVFTEPVPTGSTERSFSVSSVHSALEKVSRMQTGGCRCSSGCSCGGGCGCCSSAATQTPSTGSSSCCSAQPATPPRASCCGGGNSTPSNSVPSSTSTTLFPSPADPNQFSDTNAEAAKLVLDYASFLLQRQHSRPSNAGPATQLQLDEERERQTSCQVPASQFLINVIEKYQQERSNPSSTATSGLMQNVPLPTLLNGRPSGESTPAPLSGLPPPAVLITPETPVQPPKRSCCGGSKPIISEPTFNASTVSAAMEVDIQLPASTQPPSDHTSIPTLPSYVPGCGCGCASGAPAGSCQCGCVGVCYCASHFGSTSFISNAETSNYVPSNTAPFPTQASSSTSYPAVAFVPMPSTNLQNNFTSFAASPETNGLPSYVPGCTCGCSDNADAGSCSCGCVGVCRCNSQPSMAPDPESVAAAEQLRALSSFSAGPYSDSMQWGYEDAGRTPKANAFGDVYDPSSRLDVPRRRSCCAPGDDSSAQNSPASSSQDLPPDEEMQIDPQPKKGGHGRKGSTTNHRLSGLVPSPLPGYGCGHPDCWTQPTPGMPRESDNLSEWARTCFYTSGELMEHRRAVHGSEENMVMPGRGTGPSGSWLYRCSLAGCEKGWKSINGIQYHLQLSRAHFPSREDEGGDRAPSTSTRSPAVRTKDVDDAPKIKKAYPCPLKGCPNSYKQAAGLKYHMTHGHSLNRTVQFPSASAPPLRR